MLIMKCFCFLYYHVCKTLHINGRRNKNKSFLFFELLGLIKDKVKILVQIEENDNPVITDRGKVKVAFYKLLLV